MYLPLFHANADVVGITEPIELHSLMDLVAHGRRQCALCRRPCAAGQPDDKMHNGNELRDLMVKMHDRSYGTCGAPKVTAELRLGLGGCLPRGDHHDRCDGFDACSSRPFSRRRSGEHVQPTARIDLKREQLLTVALGQFASRTATKWRDRQRWWWPVHHHITPFTRKCDPPAVLMRLRAISFRC